MFNKQKLLSYITPQVIEKRTSKYSREIKVMQSDGKFYLSTGNLTQTGGLINDVWKPVIDRLKIRDSRFKNVLILGLAGGTLAKIIRAKDKDSKITGIEIDPVMLELGKKYLDLDRIQNLEIINKDAYSYIMNHKSNFDAIFVDVYLGDQLPEFVYERKFLKRLSELSDLVVINHLFYDVDKKEKAQKLINILDNYFKKVTLQRVMTNIMIICE